MGNQIWVAVLCHGNWGKELIEDIKKLFGLKNKFLVFPLLPNMSVEEYREEVEKVLKVAPQNTILISDLYGGTTSNIAIYIGMKYNLNAISGLNLPLILEVDKEKEIEKILENLFLKENRNITCVNLIEEFKKCRIREEEKMAEITLARVDHRLIHGQVVTKWLKIAMAKKIIIVDDYLAKETFMVDVYKMAAPSGVDVEIYSVEKALEEYNKNNFGNGNVFLLFKNVDMAYKTFKVGINYGKLQLGGIPSGAGKKMVFTAVSLDEKEVEQLLEMQENNFKIDLHIVPEENSITLDEAVKKFRG